MWLPCWFTVVYILLVLFPRRVRLPAVIVDAAIAAAAVVAAASVFVVAVFCLLVSVPNKRLVVATAAPPAIVLLARKHHEAGHPRQRAACPRLQRLGAAVRQQRSLQPRTGARDLVLHAGLCVWRQRWKRRAFAPIACLVVAHVGQTGADPPQLRSAQRRRHSGKLIRPVATPRALPHCRCQPGGCLLRPGGAGGRGLPATARVAAQLGRRGGSIEACVLVSTGLCFQVRGCRLCCAAAWLEPGCICRHHRPHGVSCMGPSCMC
eukprot:364310-Chlamydomonas_euryale.AAC.6